MRKVVVLGASANPLRFSYKVVNILQQQGFEIVPIGLRKGSIGSLDILTGTPELTDIDSLLLYINPEIQKKYYEYILGIDPGTIIFNPGTENPELARMAGEKGILVKFDCAINLLQAREF